MNLLSLLSEHQGAETYSSEQIFSFMEPKSSLQCFTNPSNLTKQAAKFIPEKNIYVFMAFQVCCHAQNAG
jgi:hypothetical protein